ncbi:phosphatase PAP2 family protein [Lutibacter sp.]
MDLLDTLIYYDKQLLLFLHAKGSATYDCFWLTVTNPLHWIPLLFILFYAGYKVFGLKKTLLISFLTLLSGITSLFIVNGIKNYIQRIRPLNDSSINSSIRTLIDASDYSFVSGHATVSFTIAFLSFWILKKHYKWSFLIFGFPILFTYSRLYLAVHFPLDVLCGMLLGLVIAKLFFKPIHFFILKE